MKYTNKPDIDAGMPLVPPVALDDQVKAVLTVLRNAHDAHDARELLAMLGLHELPDGPRIDQTDPARVTAAALAVRRSQGLSGPRAGITVDKDRENATAEE